MRYVGDIYSCSDRKGNVSAIRNLQKSYAQSVEAEALDDESSEIGSCSVGNIGKEPEKEVEVRLRVTSRFPDLFPTKLALFNVGVVVSFSTEGHDGLPAAEPARLVRRIRDHNSHDNSPQRASDATICISMLSWLEMKEGEMTHPTIRNSYDHEGRSPLMCPIP